MRPPDSGLCGFGVMMRGIRCCWYPPTNEVTRIMQRPRDVVSSCHAKGKPRQEYQREATKGKETLERKKNREKDKETKRRERKTTQAHLVPLIWRSSRLLSGLDAPTSELGQGFMTNYGGTSNMRRPCSKGIPNTQHLLSQHMEWIRVC